MGKLAAFSADTKDRLRKNISSLLSIDNPVDMAWTGSNFDTSREILSVVLADEGVDAIIIAFISFELSLELPKAIINMSGKTEKPMVVCMGSLGASDDVIMKLENAGIPVYPLPDRAATALAGLVKYGDIKKRKTSG